MIEVEEETDSHSSCLRLRSPVKAEPESRVCMQVGCFGKGAWAQEWETVGSQTWKKGKPI